MEDLGEVTLDNVDTIVGDRELDQNFIAIIDKIASKQKNTKQILEIEETTQLPVDYTLIDQLANAHAKANILNNTSSKDFTQLKENQKCRCGCHRGFGSSLPILFNEQNISFLGSGVILFFFYLRNLRLLLLFLFFVYSSFCIITNMLMAFVVNKHQYDCSETPMLITQYICIYNENSTFLHVSNNRLLVNVQLWLGFFLGIFWIIGTRLITKLGVIKDYQIDLSLTSASDYTLKLDNLPFGAYNQYDILDYLNQTAQESPLPLEIISIQVIYNMDQSRKLIQYIQRDAYDLISLLIRHENSGIFTIKNGKKSQYLKLKQQFILNLQKIKNLRQEFKKDGNFRMKRATTLALAEFPTPEKMNNFLKNIKSFQNPLEETLMPNKSYLFKGKSLIIKKAPEPSDIIWRNCEKDVSAFRFIMIWVAVFLVLYVGYAAISFSQTLDFVRKSVGVVASAIIQLFNRLIWLILSFLVTYEHNNTKTQAMISLMKKSILAQTINIIVTPMVSKYVNGRQLYGDLGVSGMALSYQFVMMVMMLFYYFLNPLHIGKTLILKIGFLRNFIIKKYSKKNKNKKGIDLADVFSIYEGPQFPIAGAYVYMTTATFHGLFYCHLQPIILIFVVVNLTFFAIILKYMLYRRCRIPQLTDLQVFQFAMFILSWGTMFYAIGSIFFLIIDEQTSFYKTPQIIIPVILIILIWFVSTLNIRNFFNKMDCYLLTTIKKANSTGKIIKRKTFRGTIHADKMSEIVSDDSDGVNIWYRKQSYFKDCNTNLLMEYESELLQYSSNYPKKGLQLKKFSQSFNTIDTYQYQGRSEKKLQKSELLYEKFCNICEQTTTDFFKLRDRHERSKKIELIPVVMIEKDEKSKRSKRSRKNIMSIQKQPHQPKSPHH